MRLSLKSAPKWLFVPPAVALLLVLGPLSMQGGSAAGTTTAPRPDEPTNAASAPSASAEDSGRAARTPPAAPRMPDLWQMTSALIGVLLLGTVGILALRRLRGGATPTRSAAPLATLRQTLRLSARQAVHAIEFDDRILLVGEHERGLVLLESGRLPDRLSDEAAVLARNEVPAHSAEEDEDDGAVPRNLVIPRPPQRAARPLPTPPAAAPTRRAAGLNDFRTLLQKVGRS